VTDVRERFADLFPAGVVALDAPPADLVDALRAEERSVVERAVERRRFEYATARFLARSAMERLGVPAAAVVPGADRAPIWPDAIVGSITHTDGLCAVAVARAGAIVSIGFDVEPDSPVADALVARICRPEEIAAIDALAAGDERERLALARLVFSAKEAFYKCQYARSRAWLGFQDASVTLDLPAGRFVATPRRDAGPFAAGTPFEGRLARRDALLATAVVLRQ
jgi:4'-phosphopantetheinyl transferase EntD